MTVTPEPPIESVDEDLVEVAILERLTLPLADLTRPATAHRYGDPTPPEHYVLVEATRVYGGIERLGGLGSTAWTATIRAIGDYHNVGRMLSVCNRALEERSITVATDAGPVESGAWRFDDSADVDSDDADRGVYSALRSYVFAF